MASLADVLRFYAAGGRLIAIGPLAGDRRLNPFGSNLVSRIELDESEQADIIAFSLALTDNDFAGRYRTGPAS